MLVAEVFIWGRRVGAVVQEDLGSCPRFNYDDEYIKRGKELSPIKMPLDDRVHSFPDLNVKSFYGLPGLIADSLPDKFGTTVLEEYLGRQGRTLESISPVERLLYTGNRGMGALEYRPVMEFSKVKNENLNIDDLVKVASDILSERKKMKFQENDHLMQQIIDVGTSAGGARAKAVIAWNRETKEIRSGQIEAGEGFDYYLIKFDGVNNNKDNEKNADRKEYTRIEYAYYLMAKSCGIEMSECELYEENGNYHFLTKRFDREEGQKLHMQTLAALAHFDYKNPGQSGYEEAATVCRKLNLAQDTIEQLYRRMVFNDIFINYDDHVKNFSFLLPKKGGWRLSPAYDITYSFKSSSEWVSGHQLRINGKRNGVVDEDLIETAKNMNISRAKAKGIIAEVRDAAAGWKNFAEKSSVSEKTSDEIFGKFRL